MFTQCPECHTVHNLKAKQLRKHRGIFRCKVCSAQFDALQYISENKPKQSPSFGAELQLFFDKPKKPVRPKAWLAATIAGLLLLIGQFCYFEQQNLVQNPAARPWLETLCTTLGCQLPVYSNSGELEVLHSALQIRPDHNYRLQAALLNRAAFAQAYPQLRLRLTDFNGDSFAERIFPAQKYLPQPPQALFAAGETVEIGLDIAAPEIPISGYLIELLPQS